ncbi:MAG: PPOX class F420-dependent oxidoreductase [Actinomycetota bacterium]|nr:PPOX class F420-dependent oxidoreductase [Actinomycetota bacterium]
MARRTSKAGRAFAAVTVAAGAFAVGRAAVGTLDLGRSERDGAAGFGYLGGRRYVNLTTFRQSGEEVTTPVWFVLVDGKLYVTTPPNSGKMKRIRNDPRVIVTPSTSWGAPRGEGVEGLARDVEDEETGRAEEALRQKYRVGLGLFHLFGQEEIGRVVLEVRPAEGAPRGVEGREGRPSR